MHNLKEFILSNIVKVTRYKQVGYFWRVTKKVIKLTSSAGKGKGIFLDAFFTIKKNHYHYDQTIFFF